MQGRNPGILLCLNCIDLIDMKRLSITCILLFVLHSCMFSKDYNVLSFGAVPDGNTLNSIAIQSAIDQAYADGGGRVVIPAGRFLSGSVVLQSGVELHLMKNAVLLGSTAPEDYLRLNRWKALIMADSASDIAVTGRGVLDGQGARLALNIDSLFYAGEIDSSDYVFPEKRPRVTIRPQVIEFVNCRNIRVTDVTIKDAASWVQSYYLCENLLINGIRVDCDTYWNNDGIDIIDCKKVRITNCWINSSDDGICLKSYYSRYGKPFCDSVYIADCVVRSSASAVKFGTASFGGFKHVVVERIKVYDTFRSAIALESYGNGVLEDVMIRDIKAKNTGNAIFIRAGRSSHRVPAGVLRNVTIKDVKVEVPFERPDYAYEIRGPGLPFFHNVFPSSITGIPEQPVENVVLENIEITYPGRGNPAFANMPLSRLEEVPEQENRYPEFSMFGELPAWGFYVRHVDGLKMKNIKVRIRKPDYRPAFVFDDVKELSLEEIEVAGDKKANSIILHETEKVNPTE